MDAAAVPHYTTDSDLQPNSTGTVQPLPEVPVLTDLFGDQATTNPPPDSKKLRTPPGEVNRERSTPHSTDDIYRQMEELDLHRKAVHELTDKLVNVNDKRVQLERENAELRRQLDTYLYTAKPSYLGNDEDSLDQTELSRRYAIIKGKLTRQAADLKEYKDKVLELQKALIEKNEQHKEYLKRTDANRSHYAQHDCHQVERQLQVKTEQFVNLEEMYRKQQRVIDKLERLLETRNNKDSHEQRVNDVLREENRLLRMQLDTLMARQVADQRTSTEKPTRTRADEDNIRLQHQLEVANERIRSLEKQLEENAKKWSRERADLRLRAQISGLGLNNPSPFPYRLTPLPTLGTRSADRDIYAGNDYTRPSRRHATDGYF